MIILTIIMRIVLFLILALILFLIPCIIASLLLNAICDSVIDEAYCKALDKEKIYKIKMNTGMIYYGKIKMAYKTCIHISTEYKHIAVQYSDIKSITEVNS